MTVYRNRKAKLLTVACVAAFALFTSMAATSGWYQVRVGAIVTQSATGDTIVRVRPGTGNTAFTGMARGMIVASDPGATEMLALILTAIALGQEISVEMAAVPSTTAQVIRSAALIAP